MSPTRPFAVVFVLGAPGAGKGTICSHLAETYDLSHYSVGDGLRSWMSENRTSPLAVQIQDKLDNQGFLASDDLNPFIEKAIRDALSQDEPKLRGILVDGFPRCVEQLETFDTWPFRGELPLVSPNGEAVEVDAKPDAVLCLRITKQNAEGRYLGRGRDSNDSREKFERRFAEYEAETTAVEEAYRGRGTLIELDVNGTKEENVEQMNATLRASELWQKVMVEGRMSAQFLLS